MRQILVSIEKHYLSPFSKLYQDLSLYKRIVLTHTQPNNYSQTVDPQTWFLESKRIDAESAKERLKLINQYLSQGLNLFDREATIVVDRSFPYFEWRNGEKVLAITDLLGNYQIILKSGEMVNDGWLMQQEGENNVYILILNCDQLNPALLLKHPHLHCLDLNRHEYLDKFNAINRFRFNLINYFSSTVEGVLLSPSGSVIKMLTKHNLKEGLTFPKEKKSPSSR